MATKQPWFKGRSAGFGWGSPQKRQGWIVYGVFVATWLVALALIVPRDIQDTITNNEIAAFVIVLAIDVLFLGYYLNRYGDMPSRADLRKALKRRARKS